LDLGSAGGPGIVRGRAQHRHGQNQPNLQQTERHRVRSSLLAKCQEYKNERPLTEPELYRDYPDRLHVHEILFEAEWHGCRRAISIRVSKSRLSLRAFSGSLERETAGRRFVRRGAERSRQTRNRIQIGASQGQCREQDRNNT
jgi:hypothetical protein